MGRFGDVPSISLQVNFQRLNDAYQCLKHDGRRAEYIAQLSQKLEQELAELGTICPTVPTQPQSWGGAGSWWGGWGKGGGNGSSDYWGPYGGGGRNGNWNNSW